MKGVSEYKLKILSDDELDCLQKRVARLQEDIVAEGKRRELHKALPHNHKPTRVVVTDLPAGTRWDTCCARIEDALATANVDFENVYVDTKKTNRATVRCLFPKDAQLARRVLEQEFPAQSVYTVAATK